MSARKVDFDVVLGDIGVDPGKDFLLSVEEDHVLIDNEEAIVVGKGTAGIDDGLRVKIPLFAAVVLL